jgi:hypothetical protein
LPDPGTNSSPNSPDVSPLDYKFITNSFSAQKLERARGASGTTAGMNLECIVFHVIIQCLTTYRSTEKKTDLNRNIKEPGLEGQFNIDSGNVDITSINEMQILCFWTLTIVLFLYKTQYKNRTWIMSRNIIFVLIYYHHKLLDLNKLNTYIFFYTYLIMFYMTFMSFIQIL